MTASSPYGGPSQNNVPAVNLNIRSPAQVDMPSASNAYGASYGAGSQLYGSSPSYGTSIGAGRMGMPTGAAGASKPAGAGMAYDPAKAAGVDGAAHNSDSSDSDQ